MATNNRISSFEEVTGLFSFDPSFISTQFNPITGSNDDDTLFMVAESGVANKKINFSNLKKSILDSSVLLSGDQNIYGSKIFVDECTFSGGLNVSAYNVGDFIYHNEDPTTFIQFESGQINLSANDSINIDVSGHTLSVNNENSMSINTQETSGSLMVSGDAYFDRIFTLNEDDEFQQITSHTEESIVFSKELNAGAKDFIIDFPKTFADTPAVFLSIEDTSNSNTFEQNNFSLSQVNTSSFKISFPNTLQNNSLKLHISATATGDYSESATKTFSFTQDLNSGDSLFEINFPEQFSQLPVLSTSFESEEQIQYNLKNLSNTSFQVLFETGLSDSGRFHVHATR